MLEKMQDVIRKPSCNAISTPRYLTMHHEHVVKPWHSTSGVFLYPMKSYNGVSREFGCPSTEPFEPMKMPWPIYETVCLMAVQNFSVRNILLYKYMIF
jgi:hypothetical protein